MISPTHYQSMDEESQYPPMIQYPNMIQDLDRKEQSPPLYPKTLTLETPRHQIPQPGDGGKRAEEEEKGGGVEAEISGVEEEDVIKESGDGADGKNNFDDFLGHELKDKEEEDNGGMVEIDIKKEEEELGGRGDGTDVDMNVSDLDDFQVHDLEELNVELTLGLDNVEKEGESKEEESGFLDGFNNGGVKGSESDVGKRVVEENVQEDAEEGEGGDQEGEVVPEFNARGGLPSASRMTELGTENNLFNTTRQPQYHSSRGLLASTSPTLFGNAGKRVIDLENGVSPYSLDAKRLKIDGPSGNNEQFDFESCMEHAQQWMGRTRTMYEAKEQSCGELTMNQQILLNELQQREGMIERLHKTNCEELQKKQMEICRRDRELYVMVNLLEGYRKALKETHRSFAEYRLCCPQLDEPLYKDVAGGGGLVLSTREIEKQCLRQEEEEMMKHLVIEKRIGEFGAVWIQKLEAHIDVIDVLSSKIEDSVKGVTVLKEWLRKCKALDFPACAPKGR